MKHNQTAAKKITPIHAETLEPLDALRFVLDLLERGASMGAKTEAILRASIAKAERAEAAARGSSEPLYTTHDVARMLRVDPSSISKWIDAGKITAFRTPGGHRRIQKSALLTFLERFSMPVPAELTAEPKA